jgi:ribonuclease HI
MRSDLEFLLVCEATADPSTGGGLWRFAIEHLDGRPYLEAEDFEQGDSNRLTLWAVVRGLESLPGPSLVTMLTGSRYVIRSVSECLPRWKAANFSWEHFGTRLPVTNDDLWRRVDRALDIHQVSACCVAAAPRLGGQRSQRQPQATTTANVTDGLRQWLLGQCGLVGKTQRHSPLAVA